MAAYLDSVGNLKKKIQNQKLVRDRKIKKLVERIEGGVIKIYCVKFSRNKITVFKN